jgi:hypothetical protein
MSTEDSKAFDLILEELRELRRVQREDVAGLYKQIEKTGFDREIRIRTLERYQQRQIGMTAIAGSAGGGLSIVALWIGKALMAKLW